MKKTFVEPRIKKIEMNLKENIASSGGIGMTHKAFILLQDTEASCLVQNTGEKWDVIDQNVWSYWNDLYSCYAGASGGGGTVSYHAVPSNLF